MVAANKMDAARAAVASFDRQFPQSPQARLLRASLLAKDGKVRVSSVLPRRMSMLLGTSISNPA